MSEGITYAQFDAGMRELRAHIDTRADKLEAKLDPVAKDVLVIQTERAAEKAQAVKRSTWIGAIAAAVVTGVWKVVEHVWK